MSTLTATARYSECFANFLLFSAASLAPCSLISAKIMPTAPASANAYAVSSPIPPAACNHSNQQVHRVTRERMLAPVISATPLVKFFDMAIMNYPNTRLKYFTLNSKSNEEDEVAKRMKKKNKVRRINIEHAVNRESVLTTCKFCLVIAD